MPDNAADMVALSFLRWQSDVDIERQRRYRMYREYYDGEHEAQLTDRQRAYLQRKYSEEFRDNYCPIVVDSLAERLNVTGFEAAEQDTVMWEWWIANRMDAIQKEVHSSAVRDGDAYVLVEWDNAERRPIFTMELAYDGSDGVKIHYSDDRRGKPLFVTKRWVISDPTDGGGYKRRLNVYYPNRIEKYTSDSREFEGAWRTYSDDEDGSWPVLWTTNGAENGEPLGLPVIHFRYKAMGYNFGRSRIDDVIPLQNQLNKAVIDLVSVADHSAFQILWATGDSFEGIDIGPGAMLISSQPDARFGSIPPADVTGLIGYKNDIVMDIGRVSNTPLSRLQFTAQIASEGTLKQQEAGLIAEAEDTQVDFGNAWEDVLAMGRRLYNAFGPGGMNEEQHIDTQWKPAATRDDMEHAERLAIWSEKLNVPDQIVWKRLGLTEDEIAEALASEQYQARVAGARALMALDDGEEERG